MDAQTISEDFDLNTTGALLPKLVMRPSAPRTLLTKRPEGGGSLPTMDTVPTLSIPQRHFRESVWKPRWMYFSSRNEVKRRSEIDKILSELRRRCEPESGE